MAVANRSSKALLRDDGLSTRRARPRHDESKPPRGHTLHENGWPMPRPKGARPSTDDDSALVNAVARAMNRIRNDINDEGRARLLRAYEALTGDSWRGSNAHGLRDTLAVLLRLRAQAGVQKRVRDHWAKEDVSERDGIARTGREIVQRLQEMMGVRLETTEARRLANLIEELPRDAVTIGGPGGPGGGRTAEQCARSLVLALRKPAELRADLERRRRRRRRS